MIINNYLLINQDLKNFTSHRKLQAYTDEAHQLNSNTNFSRTFRNTQLLRKLDKKNNQMSTFVKLEPLTKSQSLICLSLKTPIYEGKEKMLELLNLRMGKKMKRQAACQTDNFENKVFLRKSLSQNFPQRRMMLSDTFLRQKHDFFKEDEMNK